ncbi:MAG TPA: helix-turn-helix transcriptional regulator [Actinomycetota bacterium]|jgi:transcriptional regulator with XRE-family HTH domain|nr:helix-turn-helix transcriptional regulator [Actinomycetota bacterium]
MKVQDLGNFIREQRRGAQLSLRKLAKLAGVSNPYLSQIERGLRRPSADILQGIARALRISAETMYVQAGILDDRKEERPGPDVEAAILADAAITERQKQVLLQVYSAFRQETERRRASRKGPGHRSSSERSKARRGNGAARSPSPGSGSVLPSSSSRKEVTRWTSGSRSTR